MRSRWPIRPPWPDCEQGQASALEPARGLPAGRHQRRRPLNSMHFVWCRGWGERVRTPWSVATDRGVRTRSPHPRHQTTDGFQGPLPLAGFQGAAPLGGVQGRSPWPCRAGDRIRAAQPTGIGQMISAFRRSLDTWVVRGFFLIMVAAFIIWGVGDVVRLIGTGGTWVAKVGGEIDRAVAGAAGVPAADRRRAAPAAGGHRRHARHASHRCQRGGAGPDRPGGHLAGGAAAGDRRAGCGGASGGVCHSTVPRRLGPVRPGDVRGGAAHQQHDRAAVPGDRARPAGGAAIARHAVRRRGAAGRAGEAGVCPPVRAAVGGFRRAAVQCRPRAAAAGGGRAAALVRQPPGFLQHAGVSPDQGGGAVAGDAGQGHPDHRRRAAGRLRRAQDAVCEAGAALGAGDRGARPGQGGGAGGPMAWRGGAWRGRLGGDAGGGQGGGRLGDRAE